MTHLREATHIATSMPHSIKPDTNVAMQGTVMPAPADAGLNPEDKA
jgi:hypothetical protein